MSFSPIDPFAGNSQLQWGYVSPPMGPPAPISPPPPPPPPPRMSGKSWLAWGIIAVSIVAIALLNFSEMSGLGKTSPSEAVELDFQCRYAVGFDLYLKAMGQNQPAAEQAMVNQLMNSAKTPSDRLRIIPVVGQLEGDKAAATLLDRFFNSAPPQELSEDALLLRQIYTTPNAELSPADQQRLQDRYGWFGALAVTAHRPEADPLRHHVLFQAKRTLLTYVMTFGLIVIAFFAGLVLLIIGLLKWAAHKLPPRFSMTDDKIADAFLAGFAVYLAMMAAMFVTLHYLVKSNNLAWQSLLIFPPMGAAWAVRRAGVSWEQMRAALGLHRGRGFLREMFAGIVGYIAGLPLLAVATILVLLLSKFSGEMPTHPVARYILEPGITRVFLFLLACVFAPVVEELMFRGMLLGHLRLRHSWIISALVMSFIFAAIHPQGWQGIPVLAAIAITLAGLREQRGSIIASMTAHALNNFVALTMVILALG